MAVDTSSVRGLPAPLYVLLHLPGGLASGFVSVTLGFVLGSHGVGVAAVSSLVGLYLLPTFLAFAVGPFVDLSLPPRRWYVLANLVTTACFLAFAATPMTAAAVPVLGVLCFGVSAGAVFTGSAATVAMVLTTPNEERGPIAGWAQTANLGGAGLGGGLGLWLASHAGGPPVAALTMAAICLICAAPLLLMRIPPRPLGATLMGRATEMGGAVWTLARTRTGVLAMVVMTIPAALGASAGLLPAAAASWHASADLVSLVRGVLGGLTTIPGCILGGYLCRRYMHRTVYIWGALAYAGGLGAMALAPHTPFTFAAFVIANGMILGVAFGALSAIIYDALGPRAPATISACLGSLSNLPLMTATVLLGQAEAHLGVNGMLLTEAGLGVVSVAGYAALAWFWRPDSNVAVVQPDEPSIGVALA
jgi:MFS family permease